tara:strand:- start:261 stop:1208 length:948 start_codon:yes stop_codon:yes gene_type:complete
MATNINRQKILSRKNWSIYDGVGSYNPGTCSDYNCTSGAFGGTDDAEIAGNALWNNMSVEPSSIDPLDGWTINMWVKPTWTQTSGTRMFISCGDDTGAWNDNVFSFYFTNGGSGALLNRIVADIRTGTDKINAQWALHGGAANETGTGTTGSYQWAASNPGYVNANGFSMLTMKYDPSLSATTSYVRFRVFWNGNDIGNPAASYNVNVGNITFLAGLSKTFRIGTRLVSNASGMEGNLDEISYWSAALTDAEIMEIWNGTAAPGSTDGTPSNLTTHSAYGHLGSWWRFENNLLDSSGGVHTLVNNGMSFDQTNKA